MAAFALQKYRFFGRNQVSLLINLPIALPGIALNNALRTILGLSTAIVARLRRMGGNLEEASMDLGGDGSRRSGWSPSRCCVRPCWPSR